MKEYENPSYFAIIPANVRYDKNLKASEKLLYGEISALTNKSGECWASNNYFARLYGVTTQAISKWILNLKNKGYITIEYVYRETTQAIDRRIIKMVSTNVAEVSTYVDRGINICLQGYQHMFKDNNTSINNTSINNTSINNIKSKKILDDKYEKEFEDIWNIYPRKVGKEKALKSFIKARIAGVEAETIRKGVEKYNTYVKSANIEDKYIKHGSTWFNNRSWSDEYSVKKDNCTFDIEKYNRQALRVPKLKKNKIHQQEEHLDMDDFNKNLFSGNKSKKMKAEKGAGQ
jgi:hypothetical protein